jgi:hypothetical protein
VHGAADLQVPARQGRISWNTKLQRADTASSGNSEGGPCHIPGASAMEVAGLVNINEHT